MARFAALLGKDAAPFERKAAELKSRINAKFFNPETEAYAEGTQAAQALALYLGLVPEGREKDVAARLHEIVAANNYFLDFGLIGSKTVPAMLTRYGYVEDVMKMATKTEAPSWGYWVETKGYTTLAETWTLKPNFADASLNHVFMGDISAWMMNNLAGINFDVNKPRVQAYTDYPAFCERPRLGKRRVPLGNGTCVEQLETRERKGGTYGIHTRRNDGRSLSRGPLVSTCVRNKHNVVLNLPAQGAFTA